LKAFDARSIIYSMISAGFSGAHRSVAHCSQWKWGPEMRWTAAPAVDISESDKAYEITAELPGMDEKDIEVKVVNGNLMIKGERQEQKEEKQKDYYLHERRFGSFERHFQVPEGADADKIEASFKKGVLTVTLPKKPEAQKPAKKIEVKTAA
jgi:HSP20 family protein